MAGRRALFGLMLALGSLAGCGWEPLYADREAGPADAELRAIKVAPISERIGQRLELALRNELGSGTEGTPQRYILRTTLQTVRSDLGIQSTGLGTRGKLDVSATYVLSDLKTGAQLLANTTHDAESFDILANEYASVVAEDDARTRAVHQLQREIVARLTLFLQRRAAEAGGTRQGIP